MKRYIFEIKESFIIAIQSILANKVRTFLATLGIVIGVTSVVTMTTAIKGIDTSFNEGISSLGSDNLYIDKFAWFTNEDFFKIRNRPNITIEQVYRYKELAQLPIAVSPESRVFTTVEFNNNNTQVFLTGGDKDYLKTTNFTFAQGRFYNEIEAEAGRPVAVLGYEIAENLFNKINPIGKYININGIKFKVIGVLNKQGSFILGAFNPDKIVYTPIKNIFKYFSDRKYKTITIVVRAKNTALLNDTYDEAISVMRQVRGLKYDEEDNFTVNKQDGLQEQYNKTVGIIQIAGLIITGLSLFVGAIGIMNIMFVSVKERTQEIGIRKALGATKTMIMRQFLIEASLICLLGGVIGLILAIILSLIIRQFLPTSIQFGAFIVAISISLITGIISGMAPAYQASKLDPVDSLRYE
ncbi:MAG TPA: ABC transporter permease [Ignavibacteriales bacterium]|nr:ABC transporter permease [Ignavibacteriales bacterium]HOL80833.1 ABC transporter permease [Ignavibacteriales bacterium]HPP33269.1 ABC transporter permease [Ignavibacteriales bacterium]